jgi:DNA-binding NtrC family response regulator
MVQILVIDDEPGIRDLFSRELTSEGYGVETASDGEDALRKMESKKFDAVICDLLMPKLGGLDVLEAIRKKDPEIKVIMMTGYLTEEAAAAATQKGAYDFIPKPFDLEEALRLLAKSLRKGDPT